MDNDPGQRLSGTDLAVLHVLLDNPHRVLGRDSIHRMAGLDTQGTRRCDSSIVVLRKVLGQDSIRTVRRRGWILTDEGHAAGLRLAESSTVPDSRV